MVSSSVSRAVLFFVLGTFFLSCQKPEQPTLKIEGFKGDSGRILRDSQSAIPELIPVREFFDNPKLAGAKLSPDGKQIAFLKPATEKNRLNIFVTSSEGDFEKARQITADDRRGIRSFFWTRDSRYVIYSQDQGGNENFHLYRVDPNAEKIAATDLTPFPKVRASVASLPRDKADEMLVTLNQRDERFFDLYRLQVSTGKLTLLEQNPGDVDEWLVDVHDVVRGASAQVKGGLTEIRVRDGATGPFRILGRWKDEDNATPYAFTKEGDALYFGTAQKSNTRRLVKLSLKDTSEEIIFEDPKYDVGGPIISDKTNELEGVGIQRERSEYVVYSEALKKDLENMAKIHDGDINIVSEDREEQRYIVSYDSPTDPGATYLYDRASGQARFLYRPRPWLKTDQLVDMTPIQYTARDGLTIDGYLTLPKGRGVKNLPLVLVVHGGPWARDDWGYNAEAQFLANRGYAVLQVNYRSSTGYGKKFLHAGDREWGNKMLFDLIDAVNWSVAQGIANPKRLAIYGGSYGGYATLSAVAFQPGVFAAGISYVGPSNLLTLFASIPPYWQTFREIMYQRVGNPETEPDFLKSRSPLFSVDRINVPLLIAQGNNDPRVKTAESDQIVNALKAKGKPVEYLLKMDEGHGFQNPENRIEFYTRMESFLAQNLK